MSCGMKCLDVLRNMFDSKITVAESLHFVRLKSTFRMTIQLLLNATDILG